MTPSDLSLRSTWTGREQNVTFEIVHWGTQCGKFPPMNNGNGCWNYYLYLYEDELANFNDFFLEPKLTSFSENGPKHVTYNYLTSPLNNIYWHGGITFWEANNLLVSSRRSIKVGCDFNHLWDEQHHHDYDLNYVLGECLVTISQILPLLKFK